MRSAVVRRASVVLGGWFVLFVLMVGWGLVLTKALLHRWPVDVEDGVDRTLAAHRTPVWDDVTGFTSVLGSTGVVVAVVAVAVVVFRVGTGKWLESLVVATAVGGECLVFLATQLVVDRRRPAVPHLDRAPPTSSFPSGHTGAAIALYGTTAALLLWRTRRSWLVLLTVAALCLVPVCVAVSRLYRGMHHPTDVVSGLVLGGATALLSWRVWLDEGAERWRAAHPPG